MDRLHLGDPNDAEVDALLAQLNDESLMKLKVNTHNLSRTGGGFEYPSFTDRWSDAEDDAAGALDSRLKSRFSSLKLPISSTKKGRNLEASKIKSRDSDDVARKAKVLALARKAKESQSIKKTKDAGLPRQARDPLAAKSARDSAFPRLGIDSEDVQNANYSSPAWQNEDSKEPSKANEMGVPKLSEGSEVFGSGTFYADAMDAPDSTMTSSPFGKESDGRRLGRDVSSRRSERTEFFSFRGDEDPEDVDSIDAILNERFKVLKSLPTSPAARSKNAGLDNLAQFSGQLSSHDYEGYGSALSSPSSPSANLLGRSKSRSSPGVMSTTVSTSCHCSAPSPLKLLKQVSSKKLSSSKSSGLPPVSPASRSSAISEPSTPVKSSGREHKSEGLGNSKPAKENTLEFSTREKTSGRVFKVEGFGNSKPVSKESEKKEKKEKKNSNRKGGIGIGVDEEHSRINNPDDVKDMRKLLSSVADRVGLERSRVSAAEDDDDDILGSGDLLAWSVLEREKEFARASTAEEKLNRQADRVVEWARNAARLSMGEGDSSDGEQFALKDFEEDEDNQFSDGSPTERRSKIELSQQQVVKSKKKWNLF